MVHRASRDGSARGTDERCEPLTVSDAVSRYVLACRIVAPTQKGVRGRLASALFDAGARTRPAVCECEWTMDRPSPSIGRRRHWPARAVWWLKLGIGLARIDPCAPRADPLAMAVGMEPCRSTWPSTARRDPQQGAATRLLDALALGSSTNFGDDDWALGPVETPGQPLSTVHAAVPRTPRRSLVPQWYDAEQAPHRAGASHRRLGVGRRSRLRHRRGAECIKRAHRRNLAVTADGDFVALQDFRLCDTVGHPSGGHRPTDKEIGPASCAARQPAGPPQSRTDAPQKICHPCSRSIFSRHPCSRLRVFGITTALIRPFGPPSPARAGEGRIELPFPRNICALD